MSSTASAKLCSCTCRSRASSTYHFQLTSPLRPASNVSTTSRGRRTDGPGTSSMGPPGQRRPTQPTFDARLPTSTELLSSLVRNTPSFPLWPTKRRAASGHKRRTRAGQRLQTKTPGARPGVWCYCAELAGFEAKADPREVHVHDTRTRVFTTQDQLFSAGKQQLAHHRIDAIVSGRNGHLL